MNSNHKSKTITDLRNISHIQRREIQAPLVTKIVNGYINALGKEKALKILVKVIRKDAIKSGSLLAEQFKGKCMHDLANVIREIWCDEGAMEIEVLKETDTEFHFNATRCLYAEVYKKLGVEELGKCLSCERDFPFNEGFNHKIKLERTTTIMEGGEICDFRYMIKE